MDHRLKTALKERLEIERDRLDAEVERIDREGYEILSEASGENNYRDHMADQGSAIFAREMDMSLDENLRSALLAVEGALDRIARGDYGTCERCGKDIPVERLEAIPTASLCVQCKSDEESR